MNKRSIKRLFIANRGEIARRIAKTAKAMGMEIASICPASHEPPDYLLGLIDTFIAVAEDRPATYLDGELMIRLALESDCQAIHPGFGFLSENAQFADKVQKAGLIWIGPPVKAIQAMASKASARTIAEQHSIPCVPGCQLEKSDGSDSGLPREVQDFVEQHGLPILIKAALGGGGKGMRVVRELNDLRENIQRAASEALNAFGDSSLIIESYLENPRHIEVQILADEAGQVFTIGDRDCSLQRRHQKIIEEAPAPRILPELRQAMHDASRRLALAVDYVSAGTVEFLLEERADGSQKFYFLEMNTRLQVEHPVTEEVYQIDLVAWQLKIAQGESLPADLAQCIPCGHSIEARIYAEDPERNFLPSPGPVYAFVPAEMADIRWEPGISSIDEISSQFDPMIAKIVATGPTRLAAIKRLAAALDESIFCGPPANIEFLSAVAQSEDFKEGRISTFYLNHQLDHIVAAMTKKRSHSAPAIEALQDEIHQILTAVDLGQSNGHAEVTRNCFQNHRAARPTIRLGMPQTSPRLAGTRIYLGTVDQLFEGQFRRLPITRVQTPDLDRLWIHCHGIAYQKSWVNESQASAFQKTVESGAIQAPVPGRVVKIFASTGSMVKAGDTLLILESMKMEFEVKSQGDGKIERIHVEENDQVQADHLLISLAED